MGVADIQKERKDQAIFLDDLFKGNASLRSCFRNSAGKYYSLSARHAKKLCAEGLREGIAKFKGPEYFLDGLYKCSLERFSAYASLSVADKEEVSHPVLDAVSEKLKKDSLLFSLWSFDKGGASIFPRQISKIVYYSFLDYVKPIWEAYKIAMQKTQEVPEQKTQPL